MYTTTNTARSGGIRSSFRRGEAWLDAKGKWAWITATVLGFILFWPIGLAFLAYMIWGKHMFAHSCGQRRARHADSQSWGHSAFRATQMTGNNAFDSYKAEALRRLEDEQEAFEGFLQRLRNSKDKTEFDAFMEDRARATAAQDAAEGAAEAEASKPEAKSAPRKGEY